MLGNGRESIPGNHGFHKKSGPSKKKVIGSRKARTQEKIGRSIWRSEQEGIDSEGYPGDRTSRKCRRHDWGGLLIGGYTMSANSGVEAWGKIKSSYKLQGGGVPGGLVEALV